MSCCEIGQGKSIQRSLRKFPILTSTDGSLRYLLGLEPHDLVPQPGTLRYIDLLLYLHALRKSSFRVVHQHHQQLTSRPTPSKVARFSCQSFDHANSYAWLCSLVYSCNCHLLRKRFLTYTNQSSELHEMYAYAAQESIVSVGRIKEKLLVEFEQRIKSKLYSCDERTNKRGAKRVWIETCNKWRYGDCRSERGMILQVL